MAIGLLILVISCAAIVAGWRYAHTARRASRFATTRGTVTAREVAIVPGWSGHEGRWGNGGGYWPKATYEYVVDGITYTSDRWAYAFDGLKHVVAEQMLAELPDQVDVHYDPTAPRIAYLQKRTPRLGYLLVGGGVVGVVVALGSLLG